MADKRSEGDSTPRAGGPGTDNGVKDGKKKRTLFGFGKKKDPKNDKTEQGAETPSVSKESSKLSSGAVPPQSSQQRSIPGSPNRPLSSSTRLVSPAHSQIFERDVQDSSSLKPSSPAIPSHIQTENYIPPVLDDASEAITNNKLDPDAVEIVTHNSHQPASVTVTGAASANTPYDSASPGWVDELASFADRQPGISPDNASNYGSLDSADVRRLSFISFADVVQGEHGIGVAGSRDSIHMAGLTSLPSAALNRSPSPIRSPVSSQGPGTSPPTSNPGSMKGVEMSPLRKPLGSPMTAGSQSLNPHGELNIETMSQALRRTGSAELNSLRTNTMPNSPIEGPTSR